MLRFVYGGTMNKHCTHIYVNFSVIAILTIIFSQILNASKYGTGIGDIELPYIIAIFFSILQIVNQRSFKIDFIEILLINILVLITIFSTVLSSEATLNKSAFSLMACVFYYVLVTNLSINKNSVRNIMRIYSVLVICIAIQILYLHYANIASIYGDRYTISIFGVDKDPNYLAAFMSPCFIYLFNVCFFYPRINIYKVILMIILFVIFAAIFYTGSRGTMLSVFLALVIVITKALSAANTTKMIAGVFMAFLILFACLLLSDSPLFKRMFSIASYTDNVRLMLWSYALEAFYHNPIIGSGVQSGAYYVALYTTRWTASHNCFIDLITSSGLLGGVIIGVIYKSMINVRKGNRLFMFSMFVSFFMPLFFINGYETMTFWMPMVLCRISSNICKKESYRTLL